MMNRLVLAVLIIGCFASCSAETGFTEKYAKDKEAQGWEKVDQILSRINVPVFTDQDFMVTDFGAVDDSLRDSNAAINDAIIEAHESGGGRVIIPEGNYLSNGPVHLLSGVNLHLEKGAYLKFGTDPEDYTPLVKVRWEGTVAYNYSPLIYANGQKNIALTGKGRINGQSLSFWSDWRAVQNPDKDRLRQMGNDTVPEEQRVFGNGFLDLDGDGKDDGYGDGKQHFLRPTMIEFYDSENILIEGLTLERSPFWTVHPVFCKNVTIRDLTIYGGFLNDDGIDPDSCEDVLIEENTIKTEDDAISIKAGRDQDAWERAGSKNIVIRNNRLESGVNAICIGSEMSGGVQWIFAYGNYIANGAHALNFKCNLDRGGQVQHIYIKDNTVESTSEEMFIFRMDYHGYRGNHFPTKFNDFYVSDLKVNKVNGDVFRIVGVEDQFIERISFRDITVDSAASYSTIQYANDILFRNISIGDSLVNETVRVISDQD